MPFPKGRCPKGIPFPLKERVYLPFQKGTSLSAFRKNSSSPFPFSSLPFTISFSFSNSASSSISLSPTLSTHPCPKGIPFPLKERLYLPFQKILPFQPFERIPLLLSLFINSLSPSLSLQLVSFPQSPSHPPFSTHPLTLVRLNLNIPPINPFPPPFTSSDSSSISLLPLPYFQPSSPPFPTGGWCTNFPAK